MHRTWQRALLGKHISECAWRMITAESRCQAVLCCRWELWAAGEEFLEGGTKEGERENTKTHPKHTHELIISEQVKLNEPCPCVQSLHCS